MVMIIITIITIIMMILIIIIVIIMIIVIMISNSNNNNNNNNNPFINIFQENCYLQVRSKKKLLKPIYNFISIKKGTIMQHNRAVFKHNFFKRKLR